MQTYKISSDLDGERIDSVLFELMSAYSRSYVQKLIRQQLVQINDKVAKKGNRVREGDQVTVREAQLKESKFLPEDIPLDIIYEDDDLLVVNKAAGILTHPSAHEKQFTLVNALLHHCGDRLSGIGGEKRPGIVHRLDKDTSGILMVAKHDGSHKDLARQIQQRKVEKHYLALVAGTFDTPQGTIEAPLLKSRVRKKNKVLVSPSQNAKDSLTHFKVKKSIHDKYSLLNVQIITGRMHQIRVHLASISHPVVGDDTYGNKKANSYFKKLGLTRQFLHAFKLKFKHPRTKKWLSFEAPLSDDLKNVLKELEKSVGK